MTTMFDSIKPKISPEIIKGKLFSFHNSAHSLHLDTIGVSSYAEHNALDILYKELVEVKDEIIEQLQGYIGRRIGATSLDPLPIYKKGESMKLVNEIIEFSASAEAWAANNGLLNIGNKFQELQGLGAKVKFLLTLE